MFELNHKFHSTPSVGFLRGKLRKYCGQRIEFQLKDNPIFKGLAKYYGIKYDSNVPVYVNGVFGWIWKTPAIVLYIRKPVFKCGDITIRHFYALNIPITQIECMNKEWLQFIPKLEYHQGDRYGI